MSRVRARWGVELKGGEGFCAIAELLGSRVEYHRLDASRLGDLGETFDFVFCFGILHRVSDSLGLLRILRGRRADSGLVLVETYGINGVDGSVYIRVHRPGEVYADDDFVYWGFAAEGLAPPRRAGRFPRIPPARGPDHRDDHPRIIASLTDTAAGQRSWP
jgi:tRNA (mo5U34)-methyltransferase